MLNRICAYSNMTTATAEIWWSSYYRIWSLEQIRFKCSPYIGQLTNSPKKASKKLKQARYENIGAGHFVIIYYNFILDFHVKYIKILFKTPILGLVHLGKVPKTQYTS